MLTNRQEQMVIGAVLGGSSLLKPPKGNNYYLAMRSKNDLWLRYKMEELESLFHCLNLYQTGVTYRCYSRCCRELTKIRGQMFKNNKRIISLELMDQLMIKDIAIATWYLEGGGKTGRGRKNAYLNTTAYGKKGTFEICKYFNEWAGCECNINQNKKRYRVVFSIPGTEKLFKITGYLIPSFMYGRF
jgi:hypothetical protein